MKRMIIIMMLFLPYFHISAQLPDADEIMDRGRELTLMGSLNANVNLLITEKNGATRNRTIAMTTKSYPGGLEKRLIRFLEPADVRGTSMLVIDNKDKPDEMWIYLPALKKTRRIVSSEKGKSFM
ncbi:MAG: outer membrane lipoprotein-sorting protein, partial [Bacteroidetes bacterium]|nr:outer membrane lipoprotein-sorting protein [Bacteroidota bacterium]